MKNLTHFVAGLALAVTLLPAPVLAVSHETSPPTRPTGPSEERRLEARERFNEVRKAAIKKSFDRMVSKIENALERLEGFADRIESRSNKFKERGKDVSVAEAKLAEARASITAAEAALADAKTKFAAMLGSDDPKAAFKDVRAALKNVIAKVRAAHAALVDAITTLKGASVPEGTPPPTVTVTP